MKFKLIESIMNKTIEPLYKDSAKYQQLWQRIGDEYDEFISHPDFYYRGKWVNTDDGVAYRVTTWLTPDSPQYDERIVGDRLLDYVYRAVNEDEWQFINANGFIKSNQSMNIGYEVEQGLTCYNKGWSGFYLPDDGGYMLKVKTNSSMFLDEVDEYIKTPNKVSINDIVEVNGIKV